MKREIKISSIILLAIVSLPYLLLLTFFIQQKSIQFSREEALKNGPVITISIDPSEVRWFKKNKELIINNRLFDVKDITTQNAKLIVRGYFDGDETALLAKLRQVSKNRDQLSSITFLSFLFGGCAPENSLQVSVWQQATTLLISNYTIFFPVVYSLVSVPPPQAA